MRHSRTQIAVICLSLLAAGLPIAANAAIVVKTNNTHNLNLGTSWLGGVAAGSADIAAWDANVAAANQVSLGTDLSWAGLTVGVPSNPGGVVTINQTNTLSLGSAGILDTGTRNLTLNCDVILASNQTWIAATGRTLSMGGAIAGSALLTKDGAGILTMSAANSFSGGLNIQAGTVSVNADSRLGATNGPVTFTGDSTLSITAVTILGSARAVTINAGVTGIVSTTVMPAILSTIGGQGNLVKLGAGTLVLGAANTYEGATTIAAGIIRADSGLGVPTNSNLRLSGGLLESNGSFTRSLGTGAGQVQWLGNGGFSAYEDPFSINIGGANAILSWGGTTNFVSGILILSSAISDNTVHIQNPIDLNGAARTLQVDNGGADVDAELVGALSGFTGGLTKTGAGTLRLADTNTFGGTLWVQAGTLSLGVFGDAGPGASTIRIGSGATAGTIEYTGTSNVNLTRALDLTGTTGGATLTINGAGALNIVSDVRTSGSGSKALTLAGSNSGANTVSGIVSNFSGAATTGLTKNGAGTWTLSGDNTYTGTTTLNAGLLKLGGNSRIGNGSPLLVTGGTFDMQTFSDTVNAVTLDGGVITNGTLTSGSSYAMRNGRIDALLQGVAVTMTKTTAGTVLLSENNTFSGALAISEGKLSVAHLGDAINGTGPIKLGLTTTGGELEYTGSDNVVLTRAIDLSGTSGDGLVTANGIGTLHLTIVTNTAGTAAGKDFQLGGSNAGDNIVSGVLTNFSDANSARLVKNGGGRWILTGNNTYSGTTTINGGTLQIGNGGTSGTLGVGGTIVTAPGILVFNRSNASAYAGAISGTGAVIKDSANSLTLAGASSYSGGTTINGGVLSMGSSTALGTATGAKVIFAPASNARLQLNGNSTTLVQLDGDSTAIVENGGASNVTLTVDNAVSTTNAFSGLLQNGAGGSLGLTRGIAGTGILILSSANTYSGNTTVTAGTLKLGGTEVIPNGAGKGDVILTGTGDTLDLNGFDETINGLSLAGVVTNSSGAATLTLGSGDATAAFTGIIRDGGGTLAVKKVGAGIQTFGGTANTHAYAGNLTISNGTIKLGVSNILPDGTGRGNLIDDGTLDLSGFSDTINGLSGNGIIDNTTGVSTYTLTVGANDQTSAFGGIIQDTSGTIALTKIGTGTLSLSGANDYAGLTTVSAGGTLRASHPTALGAAATGTTVLGGGALELSGGISVVGETLLVNGTGPSSGGALRNIAGDNIWAATVTLNSTGVRINSDANTLTLDPVAGNAIGGNSFAVTFGGAGNLSVLEPIATTSGTLTKDGTGTLSLLTNSTYTGKTFIQQGVVQFERLANVLAVSSLGQPTTVANGTIDLGSGANSATLKGIGSGDSYTDRILNLAGTTGPVALDSSGGGILYFSSGLMVTNAGAKTLTLQGSNTGTNTLAGAIVDSAGGATSLVKGGAGQWVLRGASSYSGGTTVSAGTLLVNNATGSGTGSGSVTVNGGLLGGRGSMAGIVTVNGGGTLSPGASVGTLTVGGLDLNGGSATVVEFAANTNDQITVANLNGLTIDGGGVTLVVAGTSTPWTTPGVYRLIQYTGTISGAGAGALTVLNPQPGTTYNFGTADGWVVVTITSGVPLVSIANASVTEGDAGYSALSFTVTLSSTTSVDVVVNVASADGSARSDKNDYVSTNGPFRIPAGSLSAPLVIPVVGEDKFELDETLSVTLSSPNNATLLPGGEAAVGTILNDDASAGIHYIDDTATGLGNGNNWDDAFTDLQDGLRAATSGQQIWVAEGTYYPTNGTVTSAHFKLRPNVTMYGGFIGNEQDPDQRDGTNNPAVLSGDIGAIGVDGDNCQRVVLASTATDANFDGFTIRKAIGSSQGAGMRIEGAAITVRNCIFEFNSGSEAGAIHNNQNSLIDNCIFRNNFSNSRGGAIQNYSPGSPTYANCLFYDNTCGDAGGAMSVYHVPITFVNCSFIGNSCGSVGNCAYVSNNGSPSYINCILWDFGDHGGGIHDKPFNQINESGPVSLVNCDINGAITIEPGHQGTIQDNIELDPLFVSEPSRNLHLQQSSPCVDAGTSSFAPDHDLDGGTRPIGDGFDMGAYEFGSTGPTGPPEGLLFIVR